MPTTSEAERALARSTAPDRIGLFAALWALAAVFHLVGGGSAASTWAEVALALSAGLVLVRPGAVLPLVLLATTGLITVWQEAPVLGNHWLLVGIVDVAVLLCAAVGALRRRFGDRVDLAERLFPSARLCLLGCYAFAAFAKLNDAFLDRRVSCAVHFYRETTSSIGLDGLQLGGTAWFERAVILGTVAVELAIPVLLVVRRTRGLGVLVGLLFHSVIALDRTHEFFDFSAVIFALLLLFLPSAGPWAAERVGSVRARLALRHDRAPEVIVVLLAAVPTWAALLVATDEVTASEARNVGWWVWQAVALAVIWSVVRLLRQGSAATRVRLLPHHALFALAPLLVVANGLSPYLELKTSFGWNMYSNLRTVDGDTNHLLLPGTLPLGDEQDDVVRIVDTDDAGLAAYRTTAYALTWQELRTYATEHPDMSITFERAGERVVLRRAADLPELVEPVSTWRRKVLPFRPVDLLEPERCLTSYGPAR